jgi:hypothetical protein
MSNRPRRQYRDPIVYQIGTDVTQQEFENWVVAVGDWFAEMRPNLKAPAAEARRKLMECVEGKKQDGTPWFDMADAPLANRIRSKCRFDVTTMQPLRTAGESQRAKKDREKELKQVRVEKAKKQRNDFVPDEVKEVLKKNFKHGDDPSVFLSNKEQAAWQEYFDSYIEQFPELTTVNAKAELESLCDSHVLKARYRAKILAGQSIDPDLLATVDKQLVDMKKALGIHPDQLAKRTKPKTALSVGEAVARLHNMGAEWHVIREQFWIEECLQLFQMYNSPKADGTGWQLDEVGLFGLTKSRVVKCPKCSTENYMGIDIEEIRAYLIRKGYLEPLDDVEGEVVDGDATGQSGNLPQFGDPDSVDGGTAN